MSSALLSYKALLLVIIIHNVVCCTWPTSWDGLWLDSTDGTITLTRSTVKVTSGWVITLGSSSVTSWTCVAEDNANRYFVFQGDSSLTFFSSNLVPYLCIKWTEVTSHSFYYYVYTDFQATLNERAYLESYNPSVTTWTTSTYCSPSSPPGSEEFRVAVKQGYEPSATIDFPVVLQGLFSYTYTNGGTTHCSSASSLNLCNDVTTATFNYTACPTILLFSQEGTLRCLASITSGTTTYTSVYNPGAVDNINFFRFSCLAETATSSGAILSVSVGSCERGQTPTAATSTGGILSLNLISNCSSDITTQNSGTTDTTQTSIAYSCSGNSSNNTSPVTEARTDWFCATLEDTVCYGILFGVCFGGTLLFSGLLIVFCAHKSKQKEKKNVDKLPTQLMVMEKGYLNATPPSTTRI